MSLPQKPRVFSGIQPSGEIHIGNWLGAVRTWKKKVEEGKEENLYCIVDAHAITKPYDPKDLRERIDGLAIDLVACGVDPEKCVLFVQSDVREHTELAWYLSSVTQMGELNRMTQFKDANGDEGIAAAFFNYPVLMAADILLYKATVVPVGEDQLQHLELAREVARRFNHRYRDLFPQPKSAIVNAIRIMGLDGTSKMSKSKGNTIAVFEEKEAFWNKLRTAFTDPKRLRKSDPGDPTICNIFTMHKELSSKETQDEVVVNCTQAKWGCVDCKKVLQEGFERELVPLRQKRAELSIDKVREALGDGAAKARTLAKETIREVRDVMGLGSLAKNLD